MKKINAKAPVKCSRKIIINSGIEKVWSVLTDIDHWPDWQTAVSCSKINGALVPGTSFDWKSGGLKFHSILHTVEPFTSFGWTGKTIGSYAIHNWTLKDMNGKTEVFVQESLEGFLVGLFKKTFNKVLERGMEESLEQLKGGCEKIA